MTAQSKRMIHLLLLLLLSGGCDSRRAGVLEGLLAGDEVDWLFRDPGEDPYEWQNGRCCNDYTPTPLPIDTIINAAINPAGDLDYFDLDLQQNVVGLVRVGAVTDVPRIRLFSAGADDENEEYEIATDSVWLDVPSGTETVAIAYEWTYLTAYNRDLRLLIQGDGSTAPVAYQMEWQRVAVTVGLDLTQPGSAETWQRGELQTIAWESSFSGGVSIGLIGDVGMVRILKRDISTANELNWTPEIDLAPGAYRIVVYLAADPTVVEVSDVITIQ